MSKRRIRTWIAFGVPLAVLLVVVVWGSVPPGPPIITPPPPDAEPGRWIHLPGAANTRDIGGYRTADGREVKRGLVYRSAKLDRLSDAGGEAFRELGVNTVLDFCNRLTPWPLFGGDVWAVQLAASVRGCPMSFSKDGPREEFYTRGVRENAAAFRKAFRMLAEPERYPVLYHCAAGTDRTGVMTALLLSLLGVERETIIADFRLSEKVDLPGDLEAMQRLLDEVDSAGGIDAYLERIGIDAETRAAIREQMLTRDVGNAMTK